MKYLFNRFNESQVVQLEKEFISLYPHSFKRIEDYLARVKELHLKLGECGKNYHKTNEQFIELVLMNLSTPFDMFVSTFCTNWKAHKEDDKDYTFQALYGLLIIAHIA
jgi:hypothetical protein